MARRKITVNVDIDVFLDNDLKAWSDDEGRSKRRQVEVLLRKLVALKKASPSTLHGLGLIEAQTAGA